MQNPSKRFRGELPLREAANYLKHNTASGLRPVKAPVGTRVARIQFRALIIIHTVEDSKDHYASEFIPVTVSADTTTQKVSITVNVTNLAGTPLTSARVYLRKAGVLKTTGYTNASGVWVFSNLVPGSDYTLEVYKAGYNFGKGIGKVGTPVPVDASADVSVPIAALN